MAWDNLISRAVWLLIQPGNLLYILLLIGLIITAYSNAKSRYRKLGRRLITVCMTLFFLIGFTGLSKWVMWPLEARFDQYRNKTDNTPYAGIIVLGGAEKPSQSTASQQATLNHGAERLIETAALARLYPNLPIIQSGGTRPAPDGLSENDVAEIFFTQAGIELSKIRFERNSYNTHSNANESKVLIQPSEKGKWLLVTSAFHMPRSVGAFRRAGINFQPYPVDYKTTLKYEGLFDIGFADNLRLFDLAIHEYVGLFAYYITGRSSSLFPSSTQ